jgi:hypothetical protein
MLQLLSIILAAFAAQQPLQVLKDMNWHVQEANMTVPDPTQPDAMPNLGYTGIWRLIYGDRDEVQVERRNGFVSRAIFRAGLPETTFLAMDRQPRIRSARWTGLDQDFGSLPSFNVPRASLDKASAAFVWDHQLEQVGDFRSTQSFLQNTTAARRDYMPDGTVTGDDERQDWRVEVQKGNYMLTIAVSSIAVLLLVVIVFMPK